MDDVTALITHAPKRWRSSRIPNPSTFLACRIVGGPGWWDLDDELIQIPGRVPIASTAQYPWHAIPVTQVSRLRAITEREPGRLQVSLIRE